MLTHASRVFLPISAVTFVLGVAYAASTGDLLGVTLLLTTSGVAVYAGVAVAGSADRTALAPLPAGIGGGPDAADPEPSGPPSQPGGGGWPMLMALAIGLLVASFVLGSLAAFAGLACAAVAAVGWMAQASAERTGREANLLPLGLPVVGLLSIASVMFFMSRILLAVSEIGSTFVALGVAVLVMVVATVSALRPSLSSRSLTAVLVAGSLLMVGGGLVAAAAGERKIEHHGAGEEGHGGGGEAHEISAKDIAFDKTELSLAAGGTARIAFHNEDKDVPHNIGIYTAVDLAEEIFKGEVVTGPETITYEFPAPEPGTYYFHCDIHPNMKGEVIVK
ncbi:MAG: cupredoxin domain-containing protein [Acidimicrobiales bacterium]